MMEVMMIAERDRENKEVQHMLKQISQGGHIMGRRDYRRYNV